MTTSRISTKDGKSLMVEYFDGRSFTQVAYRSLPESEKARLSPLIPAHLRGIA